jgi:hypothetical protein
MSIESADARLEIPNTCEKIALTNLPETAFIGGGLAEQLEGKIDGVIDIDKHQSALMIVRDSSSPIPEEMKRFLMFYARMNPDCDILFY